MMSVVDPRRLTVDVLDIVPVCETVVVVAIVVVGVLVIVVPATVVGGVFTSTPISFCGTVRLTGTKVRGTTAVDGGV